MRFYKLRKNFGNYRHYKKDVIYPLDYIPPGNIHRTLISILNSRLKQDWIEVKLFKYGK